MNKNYLFIAASFAFLLFVGQVSSQDHLWTFDEGSGTISYDKGNSRNSVNAVLNNAQWRDLSKVGPGAAVHITGGDNSYVSFGNNNRRSLRGDDDNQGFGDDGNVGNNLPNGDDNGNENSFPNNDDNNGRRNFPNNDDNNDGDNFPNSDDNNNGDSFPNNDDGNGRSFPNNDDNGGVGYSPNNNDNDDRGNFSHHDHSDSDEEDNFPNNNNVGQFGTQDFTVAFWFQTTDTSVALADLIGNRAATGHGNFFAVRLTSDGYVSAEVDQDAAGTNYIGIRSRQNRLNDGNWHQVVVTRSGRTLTLYIDGSVSNSGTSNGVANINNGVVFKIGRSLVDPNTYRFALDSVFDDVSIYSNAISAYQVNALYQGATNQ